MKRYDVKIYDRVLLKAACAGVTTALVLWTVLAFLARLVVPQLIESSASDYVGGAIVIVSLLGGGVATYRFLRFPKRDESVCQRCGYSLRGLPQPRCPECGEPFEPPEGGGADA
jgi:hypothetical protein